MAQPTGQGENGRPSRHIRTREAERRKGLVGKRAPKVIGELYAGSVALKADTIATDRVVMW